MISIPEIMFLPDINPKGSLSGMFKDTMPEKLWPLPYVIWMCLKQGYYTICRLIIDRFIKKAIPWGGYKPHQDRPQKYHTVVYICLYNVVFQLHMKNSIIPSIPFGSLW